MGGFVATRTGAKWLAGARKGKNPCEWEGGPHSSGPSRVLDDGEHAEGDEDDQDEDYDPRPVLSVHTVTSFRSISHHRSG